MISAARAVGGTAPGAEFAIISASIASMNTNIAKFLDFRNRPCHNSTMAKFKPGDRVRSHAGSEGKVVDVLIGDTILCDVELDGPYGTRIVFPEKQLEHMLWKIYCECGAKYERDMPQIHSEWCPCWRRDQ